MTLLPCVATPLPIVIHPAKNFILSPSRNLEFVQQFGYEVVPFNCFE